MNATAEAVAERVSTHAAPTLEQGTPTLEQGTQ